MVRSEKRILQKRLSMNLDKNTFLWSAQRALSHGISRIFCARHDLPTNHGEGGRLLDVCGSPALCRQWLWAWWLATVQTDLDDFVWDFSLRKFTCRGGGSAPSGWLSIDNKPLCNTRVFLFDFFCVLNVRFDRGPWWIPWPVMPILPPSWALGGGAWPGCPPPWIRQWVNLPSGGV